MNLNLVKQPFFLWWFFKNASSNMDHCPNFCLLLPQKKAGFRVAGITNSYSYCLTSWKTHFPQVYICYCKTSPNLHENSETKQRESSEVLGRSLKFDMKSAKMPNIELIFTQLQVLTTLKFFSLSFSIFFLKPISQVFSIKNSNDLIG